MKLPCDRGPCAAMERILSLPAEQLKFLKKRILRAQRAS